MEQSKQLWSARESASELLAATRPHAAFDVGVPMDEMERLSRRFARVCMSAFPTSGTFSSAISATAICMF
jgi:hypothetical protein